MISFLFFSIRRAWQGFWRNALMSLAATATMVLMLLLLVGLLDHPDGPAGGARVHRAEGRGRRLPPAQRQRSPGRDAPVEARGDARGRHGRVHHPRRGAEALPGIDGGAGPRGPDPVPRQQPAVREPRGQAHRPVRGPDVGDVAARGPRRPQRHQHRGPRRARPHRHEHPAHRGDRPPPRRRGHRAVHHREHDPPGGLRAGRGDRDHAARRGVGRVHPLAVRLRGRLRRVPGRGGHAGGARRRGRSAERLHGRVLPRPAARGRLADARPRDAGDGGGRRARASSGRGCPSAPTSSASGPGGRTDCSHAATRPATLPRGRHQPRPRRRTSDRPDRRPTPTPTTPPHRPDPP